MKRIHFYLLLVTALALGLLAQAASAQTATWNAVSGNWSNNLNWNPITDPNGVTFHVIFNNGASLTLDSARTVGTYSQTGGTFTSIVSQSLILDSGGALNGGGVMNLAHYIYQTGGNVLFTNTDGTIQGYGAIGYNGLSLLNQPAGIISAAVSGKSLSLNGGGTFTNQGLMRAQSGGTLVLDGSSGATFTNSATIRSENGSNVTILFSKLVGGTLDNTGSTGTVTLNDGTLRDVTIAAGSTVTTGGNRAGSLENTLINHGTLAPAPASIFIATNTTLSGGGLIALLGLNLNSVISNTGSNRTLTNTDNTLRGTGQIGYDSLSVINGPAGIIQADISGQTLHLNGSGNFTNNGLMQAQDSATLYFSGTGTITNSGGTLHVLPTSTIKGDGGITQSAGTIDLDGGNMSFPLGLDLNGGKLIGTGTFTGPIRNNGGIVGPGHSPGKITLTGDYTQDATGTLNIEIGGATAGTGYDQLQVSGTATLNGTLNVSLINGFQPAVGDVFQFILPGAVSGTFAAVNITGFTGQVNYSAGAITLTVTSGAQTLLNISTRLRVLTDDNVLIGGFIITGADPKKVIIRGIGPSLTGFGVAGALADPVLELHLLDGSIVTNDNWKSTQEQEITDSGLAPADDLESAIISTLPPGGYTAIVRGKNGGTGVGLVEAYDLDTAAGQLPNISTRGFVDTDDNVMIGGFILGGGSEGAMATVLLRAIGPSLTAFGVAGALQNPTLELHDGNGSTLASDDDWQDTQQSEIDGTGLAPSDDRESAILQTLSAGSYTAIVRGKDNTTGVALVEAYNLEQVAVSVAHPLRRGK